MEPFNLHKRTKVNRVVPKNAFDNYTNTQQKKQFIEKILRITWANKLSKETINLAGEEIEEIQLFKIELKKQEKINGILNIIDSAIPYPIIFYIQYENLVYLSTSVKHKHVIKENNAVIDWTFSTDWQDIISIGKYQLNLRKNLDAVFKDFCLEISGKQILHTQSLQTIITNEQQIHTLRKEIEKINSKIKNCKQFNQQVVLNIELQKKEEALKLLMES